MALAIVLNNKFEDGESILLLVLAKRLSRNQTPALQAPGLPRSRGIVEEIIDPHLVKEFAHIVWDWSLMSHYPDHFWLNLVA